MPLISTSGALSINKVSLGANYWYAQWNDTSFSIANISIDNSNQIYTAGYYQPSGFNRWVNLKLNQDGPLPVVSWQKTLTGIGTNQTGVNVFFNTSNNKNYTIGTIGNFGDLDAGTVITDNAGTILAQYADDGTFFGGSSRSPDSIISDSSGNYWIAGNVNEKPSPTTDSYLVYYSKFDASNTKVVYKTLPCTGAVGGGGNTAIMKFSTTGDILMLVYYSPFSGTPIYTLASVNPTTNAITWQIRFDRPSGASTISSKFTQDRFGDIYILIEVIGGASAGVYLQKYTSAGVAVWTRKITNATNISGITTDYDGNVYMALLTGGGTGNYVLKIDGNYNQIWQRKITATSGTLQIQDITWNKNNIYINGSATIPVGAGSSEFILKLPADGTIPGTGTYVVSTNVTFTYASNATLVLAIGLIPTITGTLSVTNAVLKNYDPISLTANTTINGTTITNLT